jgi:hypothetical protein
MEITFSFWTTINGLDGGTARDSLVDSKGFRKQYNATEDPVCMAEVGGHDSHGIKTFTPEQSEYYRGRLIKDGDSPKLRREILRERAKNVGKDSV